MLVEQKRLQTKINSLQTQLKTFPEGKLICARNANRYKWYQSDGHTHSYIPKKNRHLAEQLAAKHYCFLLYEDLLREKKAVDAYLKHYQCSSNYAEQLLTANPEYQKLLSPYFTPISQELLEWMNSPYEHNPKYPEQLTHKGISGNVVRSKSEVLIDMLLYTNRIPFRYECALYLGESTIYPDFTIRHPHTGKYIYWEHFGLMDDPTYSRNACSKLQLYTSHGMIPTIHLITTYETKDNPLTTETINNIIHEYFL